MIYLDYNATTPIDPEVADSMRPFLSEYFGNPSSIHEYGVKARLGVEKARQQVATFLGCFPDEVIFTSGGTESNNYALKGSAFALKSKGNHIITSSIEHPAVMEVCRYLEKQGFSVTYLDVDAFGRISPEDVQHAITPKTILITIMHANNEVGTLQPIEEIGKIAKAHNILFHTDAAQSCGKVPTLVHSLGVDLLSMAGHKLYGPKGVGALYIRRGVRLEKLMHGADHEMNLRAGTENVLEIVGLGRACEVASHYLTSTSAMRHQDDEPTKTDLAQLKERLFEGVKAAIPELRRNGSVTHCLPNTLSVSFPGIDASRMLLEMKGVAASAGAACHSDRTDISPVLTAMGVPMLYAMGTVRFSLGRSSTVSEIEQAFPIIIEAYHRLKGESGPTPLERQIGPIKLTEYTQSLGCACKIRPQLLQEILKEIPPISNPNVLVDLSTSDDAAVYRLNDNMAIVQTVDFIPPIIDDPYSYGAISAANSLSDIYAMGANPLFALSIVAFPDKLLPHDVLKEIIRGATDKVGEAGIQIIGGHSIEDNEPKFGLVVTGLVDPKRVLINSGAQAGDLLILTKPIGTGILSTGAKRGLLTEEQKGELAQVMSRLNNLTPVMAQFTIHACTDVTGFGLLGHLKEMVLGSGISVRLTSEKVPVLKGVWELVTGNVIPGGTKNNFAFVSDIVEWDSTVSDPMKYILADAQTSGGLLVALPADQADQLISTLQEHRFEEARIIGAFTTPGNIIFVE